MTIKVKRTFFISRWKGDVSLVSCHSWCQSQLVRGPTGELLARAAEKVSVTSVCLQNSSQVFAVFLQKKKR